MNILIFGSSFSGSTLLCSLLGAHTEIFPLGELMQWYLYQLPDREGYWSKRSLGGLLPNLTVCRECGWSCHHWAGAPVPDDGSDLYRRMREHFDTEHVVDSSKHVHWYEHIIPSCSDDDYLAVLLHKPVWSAVTSRARYAGVERAENLAPERADDEVDSWLYFYGGFRRLIEEHDLDYVNLPYEILATTPKEAIKEIVERLGLQYQPHQINGHNLPLHQIAGNGKLRSRVYAENRHLLITLDPGLNEAPKHVRDRALSRGNTLELMRWLGRGSEV